MARALGVSCKSDVIYFAVGQDGVLIEDEHERLRAPALYEEAERLKGVVDAVSRVIAETGAEVVRVLPPEQTYEGKYTALAPRATLEALVRLAAHAAGVPAEVPHRSAARARVGMPRKGNFEGHIASVIPEPVGKYWNAGRKLAPIAAIAQGGE